MEFRGDVASPRRVTLEGHRSLFSRMVRPSTDDNATLGASRVDAVRQVPIDKIFDIEFAALQVPPEEQRRIREEYERYALGMEKSIRELLWARRIRNIDNMDEGELFKYISDVFHKDFKADYDDNRPMVSAMSSNTFNCYSSSVLLADAMARVGKSITVITTGNHVLLVGALNGFETTADSESAVFSLSKLDSRYPYRTASDVNGFLSTAYSWAGTICANRGDYDGAEINYDNVLKLNPRQTDALINKGTLLAMQQKFKEGLELIDQAIALDPGDSDAHANRGTMLVALERIDDAILAFVEATKLDPGNRVAWANMGTALRSAGRLDEAESCFKRAEEIQNRPRTEAETNQ